MVIKKTKGVCEASRPPATEVEEVVFCFFEGDLGFRRKRLQGTLNNSSGGGKLRQQAFTNLPGKRVGKKMERKGLSVNITVGVSGNFNTINQRKYLAKRTVMGRGGSSTLAKTLTHLREERHGRGERGGKHRTTGFYGRGKIGHDTQR